MRALLALPLLVAPLTAAATAPTDPPAEVRFAAPSTKVWLDRTQVVAFGLASAPAEDLELAVRVEPPDALEVLRPPTALAGETLGYLRVRGRAAGRCTVEVGGAELAVEVAPLPASAPLWERGPRIVAPAREAVVTGTFAVGVEVPLAADGSVPCVRLCLPDGTALDPVSAPHTTWPTAQARFEVDASRLPEGAQELLAAVRGRGLAAQVSRTRVHVVHPPAEAVLSGECEDALDAPRPDGFGNRLPQVGSDPSASGGRFVACPYNNVSWVLPVEVAQDGRYQLVITARGDEAAGALPSVALAVDSPNPPRTSARLVHRGWHRLVLGRPIDLEAGQRVLALRMLNDFSLGERADRNLYLDRWELVRLDDETAERTARGERPNDWTDLGEGLWVAFERVFDGQVMNGRLDVLGACTWLGDVDSPAPEVRLLVDGEPIASQVGARPDFALDRAHLGPGEHAIVLEAELPSGQRARTPAQRLVVPGPVAYSLPRDLVRFQVLDPRWEGLDGILSGQGEELRQRVARPRQACAATLALPAGLAGEFDVFLDSRGPGSGEPARVALALERDGETTDVERVDVRGWWNARAAGRVTLAEGEKTLHLRLTPRASEPELRLRSLVLRRVRPGPDRTPPTARLLYPPSGHAAHGVDAVVVEAFDDDALQTADVLIDGRPMGTYGHVPPGAGHVVLPLLLRAVPPGEHTLAVRVLDRAGNLARTEEQSFTVLDEAPAEPGPYARALHLLDRLAFGPEPDELAELLVRGEEAWLAAALAEEGTGDAVARGLSSTRQANRIAYDSGRLLLTYALRTDNPLRTRFVLWVDDHFSTWQGKTGRPAEWGEHRQYARMGLAPFPELLAASATSPTMLRFLDQPESLAGRLNENYARELMELHTVGVDGGYTQEEVTALATLLTGLTVVAESPEDGAGNYQRANLHYDPELGDGRACTILGWHWDQTPGGERVERFHEALELLAAHPSTARFLARKLAESYVAAPAPEDLVQDLAREFTAAGGDFRDVLAALARHPAFWAAVDAPRLATPVDYGLRVARVTGVPQVDYSLDQFLNNSGMGFFDRQTPDGYPDEDAAWADTNGLMQRWRWVQTVPWAVRNLVPNEARNYRGGDPAAWRQRVVDHAAVRLTGRPLGPESNASALAFLEEDEGPSWQQVERLTLLVCRLPEANLK